MDKPLLIEQHKQVKLLCKYAEMQSEVAAIPDTLMN